MTENYVRIELTITEFDTEDVITTSGIGGGDNPGYWPTARGAGENEADGPRTRSFFSC